MTRIKRKTFIIKHFARIAEQTLLLIAFVWVGQCKE